MQFTLIGAAVVFRNQLIGIGRAVLQTSAHKCKRFAQFVAQQKPILWPMEESLPVAGIDHVTAQSILFELQQLASGPQDKEMIKLWLRTLQVCQTVSDRLLHDLHVVDQNLQFWQRRLGGGSHDAFMLLSRGPVTFVFDVLERLGLLLDPHTHMQGYNATHKIQLRVAALQKLSVLLAEAVAEVAQAADALRLVTTMCSPLALPGHDASPWSHGQHRDVRADSPGVRDQILKACHQAVSSSVGKLLSVVIRVKGGGQRLEKHFASMESFIRRDRLLPSLSSLRAPLEFFRSPTPDPLVTHPPSTPTPISMAPPLPATTPCPPTSEPTTPAATLPATPAFHPPDSALSMDPGVLPAYSGNLEGLLEGYAVTSWVARAASVDPSQLRSELHLLHKVLGVHIPLNDNSNAYAALTAAAVAASRCQPMAAVPRWCCMPTRLQRYWLRYTMYGVVVGSVLRFLLRHSRLAGSDDLDRWIQGAVQAVQGLWQDHILGPLLTLRKELFSTFRGRPGIVSTQEYEQDKQALARMLSDFHADIRKKGALPAGSEPLIIDLSAPVSDTSLVEGMKCLMSSYEYEMKRPLWHLVSGELIRSLLIQIQRLKLDTEAAMLELDQILRANELSISLVAATPALLLSGAALSSLHRFWSAAPPDLKHEATPLRLSALELERRLVVAVELARSTRTVVGQLSGDESAGQLGGARRPVLLAARLAGIDEEPGVGEVGAGAGLPTDQLPAAQPLPLQVGDTAGQLDESALTISDGYITFQLYLVYREAQRLYRTRDKVSPRSEWPPLRRDLLAVAAPGLSASHRLEIQKAALRGYSVLRP